MSLHFGAGDIGPLQELIRKQISKRGSKRFSGRPISELRLDEMRLELGPVKVNQTIFGPNALPRIYASTQLDRAAKCMAYEPTYQYIGKSKRDVQGRTKKTMIPKRKECGKCGRMTTFRCMGGECGVWACMKPPAKGGVMCMTKVHIRWNTAWRRLKRSL